MDLNEIKFECQGSGKCCVSRGGYGFVYLTLDDRKRMSKSLKMTLSKFTKAFCTQTEGFWHLKEEANAFFEAQNHIKKLGHKLDVPNRWTNECIFLNQKRCMAYEGRPEQCRTWPFWPENMNAKAWNEIGTYCPGIGKGKPWDVDKIIENVERQEKSERAL